MINEDLLEADRDRMFDDWSEPITLREITPTFDPESQQISETVSETELHAIVSDVPHHAIPPTAGHALDAAVSFLVKTEDLPHEPPPTNTRITWQSREFQLVECCQSADGLAWLLLCSEQG